MRLDDPLPHRQFLKALEYLRKTEEPDDHGDEPDPIEQLVNPKGKTFLPSHDVRPHETHNETESGHGEGLQE